MMMRYVLCVCLLLAILTGCGKPPLGLPASHWTTSEPILGYQWYIDGKPVGKRGDIERSTQIILLASMTDRRDSILWTLQVAPGMNHVIDSGQITVNPKNLPKLDWPPSGRLEIDKRKCIFRIDLGGFEESKSEIRELIVFSEPSSTAEQPDASKSDSADVPPK